MRRSVIKEIMNLEEAMSGYCTMFMYRLQNLCVKAEEASLLSVKPLIEGERQNLEDCAILAKDGDYDFMVFPKFDEDMMPIGNAILMEHPEFKQKVDSMKVDTLDRDGNPTQTDAYFIRVTMPEVDNDRYDALKNGVKAAYEDCKTQMKTANTQADARLAELTPGEDKENMDIIQQERDRINKQWTDQRESLYEEKVQEIKDAHSKWLAGKEERDRKQQEAEDANGRKAALSMRMGEPEE